MAVALVVGDQADPAHVPLVAAERRRQEVQHQLGGLLDAVLTRPARAPTTGNLAPPAPAENETTTLVVATTLKPRCKGEPGEQSTMFFLDPSGNALEFKAFADDAMVFAK